jgi:hypothetical protein
MRNRCFRAAYYACFCLWLAGCGDRTYDGPQRFPLSGKVTVDGQPLEMGTISFIPASGGDQRVSGGQIANGTFSVAEDMGANAGLYRVEIRWDKKTGKKYRDKDSGEMYDVRKEGLPAKYHQQSELTSEVSAAQTTFEFDLKTK